MSLSRLAILVAMAAFGCSSGSSVSTEAGSKAADPSGSRLASGNPAASGEASSEPAGISRQVIELRYDMTATYRDLELRLLTLTDARCPIGVTCVWAGQMLATVEVTYGSQKKIEVELLRKAGREPAVATAFAYELRLLEVDPHPKKSLTPDRADYVLRIEIAGS